MGLNNDNNNSNSNKNNDGNNSDEYDDHADYKCNTLQREKTHGFLTINGNLSRRQDFTLTFNNTQ